jgi:hypothetical protein
MRRTPGSFANIRLILLGDNDHASASSFGEKCFSSTMTMLLFVESLHDAQREARPTRTQLMIWMTGLWVSGGLSCFRAVCGGRLSLPLAGK